MTALEHHDHLRETFESTRPEFGYAAENFPAAALNTPMFEAKDVAGLIAAAAMTLGPLAAYSFGFGA